MALKGDAEDFSLPEVIELIRMGGKTGKLTVIGDGVGICIYFKNGLAIFAHPMYRRDKFGNLLVEAGIVKRKHIEAALYKQKKQPKGEKRLRIGTLLVEMGFVAEEDLVYFIESEIKDSVYEVLKEKQIEFEFVKEFDLYEHDVTARFNIENAVLEGVRKIDEWEEVNRVLGDFDSVYAISEDPEFRLKIFTINEWKIKTLVDGKRSINEITAVAKLDRLEVCKTLAKLLQNDIIRPIETPPEKKKR